MFLIALVVQRIEQARPKGKMCVQFMLGARLGLYYSGSIGHSHCSDASSILARSTKFVWQQNSLL